MIYGQDKCINHAYGISDYFKALTNFNTVLMTQQQGGAMAFFQSIQGGGVDKGGPIRQASTEVISLIANIPELQRIRNAKASQNSLVPIGDDKVAFITDEVRHHILKQKIEEQKRIQIKSNLAKADNGFGAGYNAKDGKSVVGAAHGIEEMIKMAKMQKQSFSDDGDARPPGHKTEEERILEELQAEADAAKAANSNADLLGFGASGLPPQSSTAQQVDLLDFGGTSTTATSGPTVSSDLLGAGMGMGIAPINAPQTSVDPFGLGPSSANPNVASNPISGLGVSISATPVDPFASIGGATSTTANASLPQTMNGMNPPNMNRMMAGMATIGLGGGGVPSISQALAPSQHQPPAMASSLDRFAALDSLAAAPATALAPPSSQGAAPVRGVMPEQGSLLSNGGLNPLHSGQSASTHDPYSSNASTGLASLYGMPQPPSVPSPALPSNMVMPGSGHVAKAYGDIGNNNGDEDNDNPWVMGGAVGTGLQPVGPAPGAPPPPPPPPAY
ncbi:MAG: hypothetical protein SGILL_000231 [Bacillariaceae sp.]